MQLFSSPHILEVKSLQFRLTGREDAIETAMNCYTNIIETSKETAASDSHLPEKYLFALVFQVWGKLECWKKAN